MAKWTVSVGPEDSIVLERDADGRLTIDIPTHRRITASRSEVEELRRKLGAALLDTGDPS